MDVCDHAPLILLKMQDQISLTLCWRSFSGCGWAREYSCFTHQGGYYVENELSSTKVNILRLSVAYLNATINVKPETQNRKLEPTGLAKPGETRGFTGMRSGLARQESAGHVFGHFWNWTDPFLRSTPGPLAGYQDPLLTLLMRYLVARWQWCCIHECIRLIYSIPRLSASDCDIWNCKWYIMEMEVKQLHEECLWSQAAFTTN